ncbi:NAD-dependent epimerase/dehydratase family protein [Hydrogenophilus thiooxidans]|uniref:NAD-dependent epimerase/dehydratase family protein n=1 Tax=Hydrogenophilus thiooxidans TaxID=2820326 RepID=UPI001C22F042|nr:NAD-dependent epimerase/dehydratase family protein [Hydrogenophilus thiooxidans]
MILITGATGFIGSRLRQPHHRALVRTASGMPNEMVGDLSDLHLLERACAGITTIIHCAGIADANTRDTAALWRINVEGTRNLLTAAARMGVRRFVLLSSVKAMADPGDSCADESWPASPATPYGQSKRAAEKIAQEIGERSGMEIVILRPCPVYGRGCRGPIALLARLIDWHLFPPLPETDNRRSIVHISDLIRAIELAATHPAAANHTFIIAHPYPPSTRELTDAIRATLGRTLPRWHLPHTLFTALRCAPRSLSTFVERLTASACYASNKIESLLGWRATIDLATGLSEMLGHTPPIHPKPNSNPHCHDSNPHHPHA